VDPGKLNKLPLRCLNADIRKLDTNAQWWGVMPMDGGWVSFQGVLRDPGASAEQLRAAEREKLQAMHAYNVARAGH
jgi:hypothetical protein